MAEKTLKGNGTREEILRVSKAMFFEKGYDGVTIRNIQREVGCEVGLFYYYFKSKEEVFEVVLKKAAEEWDGAFARVYEENSDDAKNCISKIFECFFDLAKEYTEEKILHCSVLADIRERMEGIAAEYIELLLKKTGVTVRISEKDLAVVLASGIGTLIFGCSDREFRSFSSEAAALLDAVIPEQRGRSREISVELL